MKAPIIIIILLCCLGACTTIKNVSGRKQIKKHLDKHFFDNHFTGFALYDPATNEWLYEKNIDKYFTPASNTKLLSLYAGIKLLGDSLPGIRFKESGDTLFFSGTGDPTFLHSDFIKQPLYDFLRNHDGPLVYIPSPLKSKPYGPGWSWDDYQFDFQPERNDFPIYGNIVQVRSQSNQIEVTPTIFQNDVISLGGSNGDQRFLDHNIFIVNPSNGETQNVPFRTYPELTTSLLTDTLKRKVIIQDRSPGRQTRQSQPSKLFYSIMMKRSNNFYAEQLLMMCSSLFTDSLSVEYTISYIKNKFLGDLPDEPVWVDGSGLSRYNLITPRSLIKLLEKLAEEKPSEWLFSVLPAGGESGTIRNWYAGSETPFVFAKTGTLSNNHNLSGFLITSEGRELLFSFMNNNYTVPVDEVKTEMERILKIIRDNY